MSEKRKDDKGRILKTGESQRPNGTYAYRYKDIHKKEQWIYAATLKDLRDKEQEIQKMLNDGIDYSDGQASLLSLVERYVSIRNSVRTNTRIGYDFVVNLLKQYDFSSRKIRDIKTSDAKAFYIYLNQEVGYSYSTITTIRGVLKPAFDMAVEDGILYRNPFSFPVTLVVPNESEKRVALTDEQVKTYLDFIASDKCRKRWYDEVVILLETGMRVSEMYGLTRGDVDLQNRRIHVSKQLQRDKNCTLYIEEPKTKNGIRDIPMSDTAYAAFVRVLQNRKKPTIETIVNGYTGFLFLDIYGKPKVAMHLEHALKRILDKYNETHSAKLPAITPHTFRHTFITKMYNNGMRAKSLQNLAGHGDIQTTLGIYTHTDYKQIEQEFLKIKSVRFG